MQKLWIILIGINFLNNYCIGQQTEPAANEIYDWQFYEYLNKSDLHDDALTWLFGFPINLRNDSLNDKINFEISKHYFAKDNLELANSYLKKVSIFSDTSSLNYAICIAFLVSDTGLISSYSQKYPYLLNEDDQRAVTVSLKILEGAKIYECDIPKEKGNSTIAQIAIHYQLHEKKSPVIAGLLSAAIPGLGKLYLGYKYQAISAFTMNLALDAILLEGLTRSSNIIRWIIPLPIALVFYSGNILGSVLIAKKSEIDFQNNTHENIKAIYRDKLLYGK